MDLTSDRILSNALKTVRSPQDWLSGFNPDAAPALVDEKPGAMVADRGGY